jgi:DUF4097 and DUF4098 domain-containing protein YvlB
MRNNSLILTAIFIASMLGLMACACVDKTPYSQEGSFEKSYKFKDGGKFVLGNENGSIYITAWDKDELHISAQKVIKASNPQMAKRAEREIKIKVEHHDNEVRVSAHNPFKRRGGDFSDFLAGRKINVKITYDIHVPRNTIVRAKTMNGRIEVEGVEKETDINTMNGRIVVTEVQGAVAAETMNGSIEAEILQVSLDDRIKLKTMNGGIKVYLDEDIKADLKATTANGRISSDFSIESEGSFSRRKLRGEINGGGTRIELETMNGSIKISKIF